MSKFILNFDIRVSHFSFRQLAEEKEKVSTFLFIAQGRDNINAGDADSGINTGQNTYQKSYH